MRENVLPLYAVGCGLAAAGGGLLGMAVPFCRSGQSSFFNDNHLTILIYMAGIYIHVPFCKTRCIYCGFFSTTSSELMSRYVDAVLRELRDRRSYLCGQTVDTVYFGGGTPSQLPVDDVKRVIEEIYIIYNKDRQAPSEITIEANPDDVTPEWLQAVRAAGVNRLSIGVQTFDDDRLRFIHRRHTARQAVDAVRMAKEEGFDNISIDLMFGFPGQTLSQWKDDLARALSLGVQHLSAYSLMYEEGTPLASMLDAGKVTEVDEEVSLAMFEALVDASAPAGFRHYEISNFALPGRESLHNSSYWHDVPYLGVGAGAHSYSGVQRCYNPCSLTDYLSGCKPVEEFLSESERYDEHVFTRLRTAEGISLQEMQQMFGADAVHRLLSDAAKHIDRGMLVHEGDSLRLSRKGIFVSNDIMSDLMVADG